MNKGVLVWPKLRNQTSKMAEATEHEFSTPGRRLIRPVCGIALEECISPDLENRTIRIKFRFLFEGADLF